MGRRRTFPGSIYNRRGILYIKFKGIRRSTGLRATKEGYKAAEALLEQLWWDYHNIGKLPERIFVADAIKQYFESHPNLSTKTRKGYEYSIRKIIKRNYVINERELEKDIQTYIKETNDSDSSININLRQLRVFLRWCVQRNYIEKYDFIKNYFRKIKFTNERNYDDKEVKMILDYFRNKNRQMYNLIRFMIYTGARVVDALTLEWDQVRENKIFWRNKITKQTEPRVCMPIVLQILDEQRKISSEKGFTWKYSSKSSLVRELKKAQKELGIFKDNRGFQGFRVYFRMKLLQNDFPVEYVIYLMRHSNATVTLRHYTQFLEDEIIGKVQNIFDKIGFLDTK